MNTPTQDLSSLPWQSGLPDAEGYWWISTDGGAHGFVERIAGDEIGCGVFRLHTLNISRVTVDRWVAQGFRCCPVVLS